MRIGAGLAKFLPFQDYADEWHARCNCLTASRTEAPCSLPGLNRRNRIRSRWGLPALRTSIPRNAIVWSARISRAMRACSTPRSRESSSASILAMRRCARRPSGRGKSFAALLAEDLFYDDPDHSPFNGDAAVGSATAKNILEKRYSELRSLARAVASVSFEHGSDAEIAGAGKALCRLAVKLDDLMDGTERRLVTALRTYVFSSGEETRLSA